MEVEKVLGEYDSNTFIVEANGKCVIVDSGADPEKVSGVVGNSQVLAILLTHGHFDHALHALEYAKMFKCKIYASDKICEIVSDPEKNYGKTFAITDFSNFIFLEGDGVIDDLKIRYFATPGHSPGGVTYKIGKHLFAGDILFENGIGKIDLFGSDKNQMISSLQKLSSVDFEVCHSGHGIDSTRARQERNIKVFLKYLSR